MNTKIDTNTHLRKWQWRLKGRTPHCRPSSNTSSCRNGASLRWSLPFQLNYNYHENKADCWRTGSNPYSRRNVAPSWTSSPHLNKPEKRRLLISHFSFLTVTIIKCDALWRNPTFKREIWSSRNSLSNPGNRFANSTINCTVRIVISVIVLNLASHGSSPSTGWF